MKIVKYILSIVVLSCAFLSLQAQSVEELALEAYKSENYTKSIELYEQAVSQGLSGKKESPEIYYNLANAYFRNDQLGKAILNYERALLIQPNDRDIRHNLKFARLRTEDRIESVNDFFLANWMNGIQNLFTSNGWAWIGIIFFILLLCGVGTFLFSRTVWIKKTAFYSSIVFLLFVLTANSFSFRQKSKLTNRDSAIIMMGSATIYAEPKTSSKEVFQLHEGTKVKVRNRDNNWVEVEIANGSVGWTMKENIEII